MTKDDIQKRLNVISNKMNYSIALLNEKDIESKNSCDMYCCFLFFPTISSNARGILKTMSRLVNEMADKLVMGLEISQIDKLIDYAIKGIELTSNNDSAKHIMQVSHNELVQLSLDATPEEERKTIINRTVKKLALIKLEESNGDSKQLSYQQIS